MNSFKRCATAVALVMASAIPAFAQESETVLLAVEGSDVLYRVDIAVAAELCGLTEEQLAAITVDADTVFCTASAANTADIDFDNDDRFSVFDNDDADSEAEQGDLAPVEGEDGTGEDGANDGTDDAATDDGATDDGADADADAGTDVDAGADADADAGADADVDADVDADAGADVDADADVEADVDAEASTDTDG